MRRTVSAEIKDTLEKLKQGFAKLYGERLKGVYLFGSYARGGIGMVAMKQCLKR